MTLGNMAERMLRGSWHTRVAKDSPGEKSGEQHSTVSQLEQRRGLQGSGSRPWLSCVVPRSPELCMSKPQAPCPSQPHTSSCLPSSHRRCNQTANPKKEQKGSPTSSARALTLQQFGPWIGKWETFPFFLSSVHWDIWKIFTQAGKKGIILGGAISLCLFRIFFF